jgi:NAD+ kinase
MKPRVIVVAKRSSYSRLTAGDVDQRARVLLKKGDPAVRKWKPAHDAHVRTLEKVRAALDGLGVEALVLHGSHASFEPRGVSLVVTVGGDGTLLAASHSVHDVPILGVNSAPRYSVGFFCAGRAQGIRGTLEAALEGRLPETRFSRMAVSVNGQVRSERVLNEALFCHAVPAATSNYILQVGRAREEQRSSGFWIGPAAGSTAAQLSAGGRVLPPTSKKLQLVVREPYCVEGRRYRLTRVEISDGGRAVVKSKMHQARLFLDGPYLVVHVRLGDEVVFQRSPQSLRVLGLNPRSRSA